VASTVRGSAGAGPGSTAIEVTSGLSTGDRVVTAGTHKVSPGAPLRVADTTDGTAPTATP